MRAALFAVALAAFACVVAADDPTVTLPGVSDLSELSMMGTAHPRDPLLEDFGMAPGLHIMAADACDAYRKKKVLFLTRFGDHESSHAPTACVCCAVLQHLITLTRL